MVATCRSRGAVGNERNPTSRSPSPVKTRTIAITVALLAAVASAGLLAVGSAGAGTSLSASDVGDANVASASPNANYGASTLVTLDAQPVTLGYVKFAVSVPAGQEVTRAIFRCWAGSSNGNGATLRVVPNGWSEQTITWATAP